MFLVAGSTSRLPVPSTAQVEHKSLNIPFKQVQTVPGDITPSPYARASVTAAIEAGASSSVPLVSFSRHQQIVFDKVKRGENVFFTGAAGDIDVIVISTSVHLLIFLFVRNGKISSPSLYH